MENGRRDGKKRNETEKEGDESGAVKGEVLHKQRRTVGPRPRLGRLRGTEKDEREGGRLVLVPASGAEQALQLRWRGGFARMVVENGK